MASALALGSVPATATDSSRVASLPPDRAAAAAYMDGRHVQQSTSRPHGPAEPPHRADVQGCVLPKDAPLDIDSLDVDSASPAAGGGVLWRHRARLDALAAAAPLPIAAVDIQGVDGQGCVQPAGAPRDVDSGAARDDAAARPAAALAALLDAAIAAAKRHRVLCALRRCGDIVFLTAEQPATCTTAGAAAPPSHRSRVAGAAAPPSRSQRRRQQRHRAAARSLPAAAQQLRQPQPQSGGEHVDLCMSAMDAAADSYASALAAYEASAMAILADADVAMPPTVGDAPPEWYEGEAGAAALASLCGGKRPRDEAVQAGAPPRVLMSPAAEQTTPSPPAEPATSLSSRVEAALRAAAARSAARSRPLKLGVAKPARSGGGPQTP